MRRNTKPRRGGFVNHRDGPNIDGRYVPRRDLRNEAAAESQLECEEKPQGPCSDCFGKGWYPETYGEPDYWGVQDVRERYCSCERGNRLMKQETDTEAGLKG